MLSARFGAVFEDQLARVTAIVFVPLIPGRQGNVGYPVLITGGAKFGQSGFCGRRLGQRLSKVLLVAPAEWIVPVGTLVFGANFVLFGNQDLSFGVHRLIQRGGVCFTHWHSYPIDS